MRSGLGGHETLNLYGETIAKMPENPGIPPLFRDIFKNAFLPYRDPETLRAFLKIIDQFEYDTLTSQERWNDYADVILADPPFMSQKGGIKPHNRFSVQSKRSARSCSSTTWPST